MDSEQPVRRTIDKIKKKTLMQSGSLALVSFDIFAYDRVGMVDVVYEMLALIEQSKSGAADGLTDEDASLTFRPDDGSANDRHGLDSGVLPLPLPDSSDEIKERVVITSLMIGEERRVRGEREKER